MSKKRYRCKDCAYYIASAKWCHAEEGEVNAGWYACLGFEHSTKEAK